MGWSGLTPLGKWLVSGLLALVVLAAVLLTINGMEKRAKKAGSDATTVVVQKKVIEDVQTANQARTDVSTRSDQQRVADCLRRSRTPENCQ